MLVQSKGTGWFVFRQHLERSEGLVNPAPLVTSPLHFAVTITNPSLCDQKICPTKVRTWDFSDHHMKT